MKLVYVLFKLKQFNCRVLCKTDCLFLDCSSVISMYNSLKDSLYLFNRLLEVFRFTGNIVGLEGWRFTRFGVGGGFKNSFDCREKFLEGEF